MITKMKKKYKYLMDYIDPATILSLDSQNIIVVNRVALNSRRVQVELCVPTMADVKTIEAIDRATIAMRAHDKVSRVPCFGVAMTVADACLIFDNLEQLPKNTFAQNQLAAPFVWNN